MDESAYQLIHDISGIKRDFPLNSYKFQLFIRHERSKKSGVDLFPALKVVW